MARGGLAFAEPQETVPADGNYYHGRGDRFAFASLTEPDAQSTDSARERFTDGQGHGPPPGR